MAGKREDKSKKTAFVPIVFKKDDETTNKIKNKLLNSYLFSGISEADIKAIADSMKVVNVKEGSFIVRQGDSGNDMYVVESGRYSCIKTTFGKKESTVLRSYQDGEVFGELCLLYNCKSPVSIKALEDGVIYALDRQAFNHFVKDTAAKQRQKLEEYISSTELLKGMLPYERVFLIDSATEAKFKQENI